MSLGLKGLRGLVCLWQALLELDELVPAIQAAESAVTENPQWATGHQTLGHAQLGHGDIEMVSHQLVK